MWRLRATCRSVERAGGAEGSGGRRPGAFGRPAFNGEGILLYRPGGLGAPGPSSEFPWVP